MDSDPPSEILTVLGMTKQDILDYFSLIDFAYNECGRYDSLSRMLDELLDEEHRRLLSWLGKFCRHIDNGDAWLTDEENISFFKEKMKQQFGWDTD